MFLLYFLSLNLIFLFSSYYLFLFLFIDFFVLTKVTNNPIIYYLLSINSIGPIEIIFFSSMKITTLCAMLILRKTIDFGFKKFMQYSHLTMAKIIWTY